MPPCEERGSTAHQRWARVPPGLAWKRSGPPAQWVRVLERHPPSHDVGRLAALISSGEFIRRARNAPVTAAPVSALL
jgi:hypothetical protein